MHIHSAPTATELAHRLATRLVAPHADPFGRDVVVVPSVGMREYLIEFLCREGSATPTDRPIVANVDFIFPSEFDLRVLGHRRPDDDPWGVAHLRWTILDILQREDHDLLPGFKQGKRQLARAEKAARLFEKYAAQRPRMIADWAAGEFTDGVGPLDPIAAAGFEWQYSLWRRVRQQLGTSHAEEVVDAAPSVDPLERYWLFALEFFSSAKISLLAALGRHAPVEVFALQPLATKPTSIDGRVVRGLTVARSEFSAPMFNHPLNRSWGSIAHETGALVGALAGSTGVGIDHLEHHCRDTLLGRLQGNIFTDAARSPAIPLAPGDRSVQVHFCHGPTRQVQVLRDALLHLFEQDPDLTPRDVLVLCYDLPTFAPLIGPIFDNGEGPRIPVTIVDRAVTTLTPVESAIEAILATLQGRCTVGELLDVISQPPVQASVDLTADEVQLIDNMLDRVDVRWGIDADHRAAHGYVGDDVSTWRHAVDRMLLGAVVQATGRIGAIEGITPLTDVDSQSALAAAKLSTVLTRLESLAAACRTASTGPEWSHVLSTIIESLVHVPPRDHRLLTAVRALANQLSGSGAAATITLEPSEFFDAVRAALSGTPMRAHQWADAVRVATPQRFRGVPSPVVVLLGMDEDRIRVGGADGDDLLAVTAQVGDRDARSESRLGLLTSICSAATALIVVADGHTVTDNTEVPPAMPVRELIDELAAMSGVSADELPCVVRHSRQATDTVNLGVGSTERSKNVTRFIAGPWSFDSTAIRIAERVAEARSATTTVSIPDPLPPIDDSFDDEVTIDLLVRAMRRPAETFVFERLRMTLPSSEAADSDALPLWPGQLERWKIGDGLLRADLDGDANWAATRPLDGGVPPAALGAAYLDVVATESVAIAAATRSAVAAESGPEAHRIHIAIPDHRWILADTVITIGRTIVEPTFSTFGPHLRYKPLLQLAALTVSEPTVAWSACIAANGDSKSASAVLERFAIAGDSPDARKAHGMEVLRYAASMRDRALRAPVPAFAKATWQLGIAKPKEVEALFNSDLKGEVYGWLFPGVDLAWLSALPSGPLEADLPEGSGAAIRYALALRAVWDDHVSVILPASPDEGASS